MQQSTEKGSASNCQMARQLVPGLRRWCCCLAAERTPCSIVAFSPGQDEPDRRPIGRELLRSPPKETLMKFRKKPPGISPSNPWAHVPSLQPSHPLP